MALQMIIISIEVNGLLGVGINYATRVDRRLCIPDILKGRQYLGGINIEK